VLVCVLGNFRRAGVIGATRASDDKFWAVLSPKSCILALLYAPESRHW
jgi:hypothetical protein